MTFYGYERSLLSKTEWDELVWYRCRHNLDGKQQVREARLCDRLPDTGLHLWKATRSTREANKSKGI